MRGYLLDTNGISELVRPKPDPRVVEWMQSADESQLYLSVLTLGEIRKGVAELAHGRRKANLETWLDVELQGRFRERILPIDAAIADRWGQLAATAKRKGKTLPVIDGLLAATALHHNLTLVTRNISDFVMVSVPVLNPWVG